MEGTSQQRGISTSRAYSRGVGLAILAAVSTGCVVDGIFGGGSTDPSEQAIATYQCGPAGGVDGVTIHLALGSRGLTSLEDLRVPYAFVTIPELPDDLTPGSWAVGKGRESRAVHHSDADQFETTTSGVVTIHELYADRTITGSVDLEFAKAGRVRGDFEAAWEDVYCV